MPASLQRRLLLWPKRSYLSNRHKTSARLGASTRKVPRPSLVFDPANVRAEVIADGVETIGHRGQHSAACEVAQGFVKNLGLLVGFLKLPDRS
jgi:hypothetical protein